MAADRGGAGRYGGYGQAGYEEEAADEPGVQADFDEEESRAAEPEKGSRKGAKAQREGAKRNREKGP
jgi:hypothetical protein